MFNIHLERVRVIIAMVAVLLLATACGGGGTNVAGVGSGILRVQPMNPLTANSGAGASPEARNYGITFAAMSQYAKSINMSVSSAMVTAMMNDASDGMMDGMMSGSQIPMSMGGMMGGTPMMGPTAGTSNLAAEMKNFMNSAANMSGLTETDMAQLITKLTNSDGTI